ncbi:restriction endonuclease subunit S [Salibacter halophilus]|uniref:Restriction endonuclease subunit S n=1 Tax=Salibacter halophilus TaxID=1803916 RepID=A0A6N6M8P8_9FLAO|nr:restriction endonuclease subunit S [Salibacter halophilus]KAB1065134.1 restriction endonuclease subunit S [Salibacter halophilus]
MAEPYLPNKQNWPVYDLSPSTKGIIASVDSGGTPSTRNKDYWEGDIPWLTPKELSDNAQLYVSTTERKISELGLSKSAAKLMPAGSVLLTKRAPVGLVAVNTTPMATNQGFLNFQVNSKIRPLYLAYWLKANTKYLHAIANGSTYDELYKGDLFEFQVAVPSLSTQDHIINILKALQFQVKLAVPLEMFHSSPEELNELRDQNRKLEQLLDKITLLLLSGAINVNQPIEPLKV